MSRIGFVGFGEVNTPVSVIEKKCGDAARALAAEGLDLLTVFPVADDSAETQVRAAVAQLAGQDLDALVLCVAGWIPTHAVVKVTEQFRHLPMVLWGLCGWYEDGRLVTTADQAGTSGLRAVFEDLGYTFKYVYDVVGRKSRSADVASFCTAASAARSLRSSTVGMAG
jgi:hypothetical protein